ncbi:MAG: DUF5058 family protein [Candidatus Bathyarchaeota archaeon]|nr:MAG: DUF5058 family protein [Candidatus Bathyarchaeota archaeon]
MEFSWMGLATGTAMWLMAAMVAANGAVMALIFYRRIWKVGIMIGMRDETLKTAIRSSIISSIGPCLGIFSGMVPLVIALGGAISFLRESAGVGAIFVELWTATEGAGAVGAELTAEGMTLEALQNVLWIMASCSVGWVIVGCFGCYVGLLPKIRDRMSGGDPNLLRLIISVMMVGVFSKLVVEQGIIPGVVGDYGPLTACLVGFAVALGWRALVDILDKPRLNEYFLLIAIIAGMAAAQILVG